MPSRFIGWQSGRKIRGRKISAALMFGLGKCFYPQSFCQLPWMVPLSDGNGWSKETSGAALDLHYWQENEGRRMALNENILLPSFFCQ
jgi:hypothetical protein